MDYSSKNELILGGQVITSPCFSHTSHNETFSLFTVASERMSKTRDFVNIIINDKLLNSLSLKSGDFVKLSGELRSFNYRSPTGNHLIITAFVKKIENNVFENVNQLSLTGVICKAPIYRKTPLGREICDLMLAINRNYGRADYLPCIAWGQNAYYASTLTVGTVVELSGRIQSRDYIKTIDGTEEKHTTYEVSVSSINEKF